MRPTISEAAHLFIADFKQPVIRQKSGGAEKANRDSLNLLGSPADHGTLPWPYSAVFQARDML